MERDWRKRKIRRNIAYGIVVIIAVGLIGVLGSGIFRETVEERSPRAPEDAGQATAVILTEADKTASGKEGNREVKGNPGEEEDQGEKENPGETGDSEEKEDDTDLTKEGEAKETDVSGETSSQENGDGRQKDVLTILMAGDILLHDRVEESAGREDGSYNFDAIFEHVSDEIQAADLAIVNQEVIMGGAELKITGYPNFNAPYEIGDALVKAGFDVICHATNHALDRHEQGILNTLGFWREHYPGIGVLGIYDRAEDRDEIYTCEINGITIAILNYTYGTNGIPLPDGMPYAVNLLNKEQIRADLERAEECADFTIVVPHWGTEYRLTEDERQSTWAEFFLENGADLVLGAHPHVIEPVAWMEDETGENQMLVYYSVGNFVNWTGESVAGAADRMVGGMAEVRLARGEDGRVYIEEYGVEPIVCHVETGQDKVTVYRLSDYTQEMADRNEIRLQDAQFSLEYCKELCRKVWKELGPLQIF